jgi:hypothetical protein
LFALPNLLSVLKGLLFLFFFSFHKSWERKAFSVAACLGERGQKSISLLRGNGGIFTAKPFFPFTLFPGLPDGLFSNQKSQFGCILKGL